MARSCSTSVHQLMIGNTYTLSPRVLNEFRFGYNSFFNTFGRELAFVRDVVSELAIPGVTAAPDTPEAWGIPSIGVSGFSGLRRQHGRSLHQPQQSVRVHRQPVLVPRQALVQGRRRHPDRSLQPGREPVRTRFVRVRRTGHGIGHGRGNGGSAPRSPIFCWDTCVAANRRWPLRRRTSAPPARPTTSPTTGACATT